MRKLLIGLSAVFLFSSCQLSYPDDTVLINHSSRHVTVNLAGADAIELYPHGQPDYTRTIRTLTGMNPNQRLRGFSPDKRVYVRYNNSTLAFEFRDRESFNVTITHNLTGLSGTLTADGWMDSINFNPLGAGMVYTSRPRFSAMSENNAPLPVFYNRNVDGSFNLTIGN